MIRAYKFLLRPTKAQAAALTDMLRDHCSLYNGALQERRDAYRHASKTSIKYGDQSAQLKEIRAFDPERQGRWSFSSQQATLRRLDKAFQACDHDVIAHERLNTAGMTKSPAPRPDPDNDGTFLANGAAAKAGLNRSILDASWAQFLGILANKAESAGRLVVPVDARNTSRTCPECRHVAKGNRATQAKFQCTACGYTANADHVGAMNVLNRAGLVLCDVA
ncbi:RNA-guided endonuclease InsQ/TnpB family protein [Streptomyces sp. NPDC088353]|uniref:RNA-guided endonuclease InsQ/TnpB family protein n=1 Tax=Streptomyces sp. NPDC088353 TaxID=3365855 RepID=UPI003812C02C